MDHFGPRLGGGKVAASGATTAGVGTSAEHKHAELARRYQDLAERRVSCRVMLESARQEEQGLAAEARRLGAGSLEELEALVARQEKEDAQALEAYQKALDAEEALLDQVERDLAAVEAMNAA